MTGKLNSLLNSDPKAKEYFLKLPQYAREAVEKHADEIDNAKSLRLFAKTFMKDDSYRGA